MLISLIGGAGFIGTRLARRLCNVDGAVFSIIDKVPSRAFPDMGRIADVRSLSDLRATISDNSIIVNLAAEHWDDVRPLSLYNEVNVGGAKNICVVARERGIKTIVFTSTVAVYGFAPIGTDEFGHISPFNEYGRSKAEAEQVYKAWQLESPGDRTLVIVRPTVVFGEQNRGNVYNLLYQIARGKFVMVGAGRNKKSIAYVENVAAFLQHTISFTPGLYIYNYVDKPDFTMNDLIEIVRRILGGTGMIRFRLPYALGYAIGKGFDILALISGRKLAISSIRVKKFCADSVFETGIAETGFIPPVPLPDALMKTVTHEFVESHQHENLFYSE